MLSRHRLSLDHHALASALLGSEDLLLIQDLDGVCMGLVRDPLTRSLDPRYIRAVPALAEHFRVLTNGEHIGRRGVNALVKTALKSEQLASEGHYLPGLAGGGVQLQDAYGEVFHPGVSEAELGFLAQVPAAARAALGAVLKAPPFDLADPALTELLDSCVLDNRVSPTLNLNPLYQRYADATEQYQLLQRFAGGFMRGQLEDARDAGLGDSFFVHLAPNLGRDERGERLRLSDGSDAGTTDFQFMLAGAVKEVGVLVLLNQHLHRRSGRYPLGEHFNARAAPRGQDALLELADRAFRDYPLPRLVGVGDTVTSQQSADGAEMQRGGSDRGFLTLVQALGENFATDNATVFVDSSAGEVKRPGIDIASLHHEDEVNWASLAGISDPDDPLTLNFIFPGGHEEYVAFFCDLAATFPARGRGAQF
jgi:glucosylglycerol 3-phosphatase